MKISIQSFDGIAPRIRPRYQKDGQAQEAYNCDLSSQSLRPLLGFPATPAHSIGKKQEEIHYYRYNGGQSAVWFSAGKDFDIAPSQIADDTHSWVIISGQQHLNATYDTLAISGTPGQALVSYDGGGLDLARANVWQGALENDRGGIPPIEVLILGLPAPNGALNAQAQEYQAVGTAAALTLTAETIAKIRPDYGLYGTVDGGDTWVQVPLPTPANGASYTAQEIAGDSFEEGDAGEPPQTGLNYFHRNLTATVYGDSVTVETEATGEGASLKFRYDGPSTQAFTATGSGSSGTVDTGSDGSASVAVFSEAGYSRLVMTMTTHEQPGKWFQVYDAAIDELNIPASCGNAAAAIIANAQQHGMLVLASPSATGSLCTLRISTAAIGPGVYIGVKVLQIRNGVTTRQDEGGTGSDPVGSSGDQHPAVLQLTKADLEAIESSAVVEVRADDGIDWFKVDFASKSPAALQEYFQGRPAVASAAIDESGGMTITSVALGATAYLGIRIQTEDENSVLSAAGGVKDPGLLETRVYIWTFVRKFFEGEAGAMTWESAPSPPCPAVEVYADQGVVLSGAPQPYLAETGSSAFDITHLRLYRSVAGTYLFLDEIEAQAGQEVEYIDTKAADDLGEEIPSMDWDFPPMHLRGVTNLPGGVVAAFRGKDVYFCEPYRPYAWPRKYQLTLQYEIVGMAVLDTTLCVLTTGLPYFIQGSHPDAMVVVESDIRQACVSKRSIVAMNGAVLYASPDGLIMLAPGGSKNLTVDFLLRSQWQGLAPESMIAFHHDNKYVCFHEALESSTEPPGHNDAVQYGGFIYDFDSARITTHNRDNQTIIAGYNDLINDTLYLANAQGNIYAWQNGQKMTYYWKSKTFSMPRHMSFSSMEVDAEDYDDITVYLYASNVAAGGVEDMQLIHTQAVSSRLPFRLPVHPARDWELWLIGTSEVFAVNIAQSMEELASV